MNHPRTRVKILLLTTVAMLMHSLIQAQEKVDLEKMRPKRFIDKWELLAGPSLIIPDGKDQLGTNPHINSSYNSILGYSVGLGLIHTEKKFEIRARVLWDQRGYQQKITNKEVNSLYEFADDRIIKYVTVSVLPTIVIGRNTKVQFFLGASYSKLSSLKSTQTTYLNGQLLQVYRTTTTVGTSDDVADVVAGLGYKLFARNNYELLLLLQANHDFIDTVNGNGQVISNNSFNLNLAFRIKR